jgi:hypothetical protein
MLRYYATNGKLGGGEGRHRLCYSVPPRCPATRPSPPPPPPTALEAAGALNRFDCVYAMKQGCRIRGPPEFDTKINAVNVNFH